MCVRAEVSALLQEDERSKFLIRKDSHLIHRMTGEKKKDEVTYPFGIAVLSSSSKLSTDGRPPGDTLLPFR